MFSHWIPCGADALGRPLWAAHDALAPSVVDESGLFRRLVHSMGRLDGIDYRYAAWLDSSSAHVRGGAPARWSVMLVPSEVLRYETAGRPDPRVDRLAPDGMLRGRTRGTIVDVLEQRLTDAEVGAPETPSTPPGRRIPSFVRSMIGAWFGYFGYEIRADLGFSSVFAAETPDAVWMVSTRLVIIDHRDRNWWIVGDETWVDAAVEALGDSVCDPSDPAAAGSASSGSTPASSISATTLPVDVVLRCAPPDRDRYMRAIGEALEEIRDGNSYEVCLTAASERNVPVAFGFDAAANLYARQRRSNPAPHAAFLWCDDVAVLSSSPERFVAVDADGWCEAKPIKGTTPRRALPEVDAKAARDMAADPKTRAENLMIVDLLRNDFSRVCEPGSIRVPVLMGVESYATVHQLVSTVRGRLRPGRSAIDLVRACFPGGSMTGAPKPRTMEIIDRLEARPRGIYSGALGYVSPSGESDLSIVIRTIVMRPGPGATSTVGVSAGGAIVADSDPSAEYDEMLTKLDAPVREPAGAGRDVVHTVPRTRGEAPVHHVE